MMKFDYKEPEFKVVKAASDDVITTSAELDTASSAWDTGAQGGGVGFSM